MGPGTATALLPRFGRHLGEAALEKSPLGRLLGQRERPLIGRAGLGDPTQPPAEVRARRVGEAVSAQLAVGQQGID